jgi:hypothetical protein
MKDPTAAATEDEEYNVGRITEGRSEKHSPTR